MKKLFLAVLLFSATYAAIAQDLINANDIFNKVSDLYAKLNDLQATIKISKGDKVHWNTSQGKTTGKAVEKKTKEFTLDAVLFHRAEALEKKGDRAVCEQCRREWQGVPHCQRRFSHSKSLNRAGIASAAPSGSHGEDSDRNTACSPSPVVLTTRPP